MATREAIEARKKALERELARRSAKKSTSELQAALLTGRDVLVIVAEDRDVREAAWGDGDGERPELDGDSASRRQAARITRGRSS